MGATTKLDVIDKNCMVEHDSDFRSRGRDHAIPDSNHNGEGAATHKVDNDPGKCEAEQHPPLDAAKVRNGLRDVEGLAVPEVLRLRRQLALGHEAHGRGGAVALRGGHGVVHRRAIRPRQGGLEQKGGDLSTFTAFSRDLNVTHGEGVEQVVETPRDDHVVVAADDDGADGGAEADPAELRVHEVPDDVRAAPQLLPDAQLQEEQRHSLEDHHDQERDHEGACNMLTVVRTFCRLPFQQSLFVHF